MTELDGYLDTIEPELLNILKLFGLPEALLRNGTIRYTSGEDAGRYVFRFVWEDTETEGGTEIPSDPDERLKHLHRKRAARRCCRQTLYDLCKNRTGIHPPWGSMTGIRPTRLMVEALEEEQDPEKAARIVSERFDVLPEKAALLRQIVAEQSLLPAPNDRYMDVYIGIPFCTTRCSYCSFSSGEIGDGKLVEPYLEALFKEIGACGCLMREAGKTLRAIYVGGGTPTSLNEDQLKRLLDRMLTVFPDAWEMTVEAGRPDTLTVDKLRIIRSAGVNRISINPQTMNDRTLQIIGRAHTARQVEEAYAMARTEGINHINMDVIAGLPGEGAEDFRHTMDKALTLKPESLTVHTLAIKRSSRMSLENAPLPDAETAYGMVRTGRETAEAMGMRPYYMYRQKYMAGNQENTGYALPGHACLYNVDIMEETSHILALGAGGISKRVFPEEGHIERGPNVSNIEVYIARVDEMIARKRALFLTDLSPVSEIDQKEGKNG